MGYSADAAVPTNCPTVGTSFLTVAREFLSARSARTRSETAGYVRRAGDSRSRVPLRAKCALSQACRMWHAGEIAGLDQRADRAILNPLVLVVIVRGRYYDVVLMGLLRREFEERCSPSRRKRPS